MKGGSARKFNRASLSVLVAVAIGAPVAAPAAATGNEVEYLRGPVWARNSADWNRTSSPTIADITGDGVPEIIFGSQDGWLQVLNADGNNVAGWPQPVIVDPGSARHATAIDSSPTVGDLDRDGRPEIIVGAGSNWPRSNSGPGGVVVFKSDGSVRCRSRMVPDHGFDAVYSTPAVGDINGDGYPDFAFGSFNHNIHALDRNCNELPGFPYFQDDTIWSSPVLYDVDGDGRTELFIGCDSTAGGPVDWQGGIFRRLDWQNGGVVQVWQRAIYDTFYSSAALGDIDGDGRFELVTGAGNFFHHPDGRKVWAFHADDGSNVAGWPQETGGTTHASPAIGDLDGDGKAREVAIGTTDGNLYAFRGNGQRMWVMRPSTGTVINASPIVADLTGDGAEDVIIGNDGATFLVDGRSGVEKQRVGVMWSYETSAALGKFGSRGWRLVTSAINTPLKTSRLDVYAVRAPKRTPSWPMWRKNARHMGAPPSGTLGTPLPAGYCSRSSNPPATPSAKSARGYWFLGGDGGVFAFRAPFYGSLPGIGVSQRAISLSSSPSGNGYWMLADNAAVYAFGDARSYGSMAGRHLNAPIRTLVSTPTGRGYWLLAADGGIFSFGDAKFYGSTGNMRLASPVISMAATPTGRGYWLLGGDGGIFSFGDARFYGSTGNMRLAAPVISMTVRPQGDGYWLLAADGGVFSFGASIFKGSLPGTGLCTTPVAVQMRATATGKGYWMLGADGGVFSFGDAKFYGSQPGLSGDRAALDMAIRA